MSPEPKIGDFGLLRRPIGAPTTHLMGSLFSILPAEGIKTRAPAQIIGDKRMEGGDSSRAGVALRRTRVEEESIWAGGNKTCYSTA